ARPGCARRVVDAWAPVVASVHATTPARVGIRLDGGDLLPGDLVPGGRLDQAWLGRVTAAGFGLVELSCPPQLAGPDELPHFAALCAAVRAGLPGGATLAVAVTYHPARDFDPDPVLEVCSALRDHDVEVVTLRAGPPGEELLGEERRWRHQALGGLVRAEAGMHVLLDGGVLDGDEAETAVLAGRADVCVGRPRLTGGSWQADP
ncbi:MAG: hypothetical protein ACRDPT_02455, partial [Streptomycetales bacterium]